MNKTFRRVREIEESLKSADPKMSARLAKELVRLKNDLMER